ncbi:hypothetical protein ACOI1H_16415 [Loktanella sp. DJP18]|uniref:hypothetical protein n=1 Tax=Loktanella sp. DJP18 TaxID=3409788 RepID=UPI003BB5F445
MTYTLSPRPVPATIARDAGYRAMCGLCQALGFLVIAERQITNLECTPEDTAWVSGPRMQAEDSVLEILAKYPEFVPHNRETILTSLSARLIVLLPDAKPGSVCFSGQTWSSVLAYLAASELGLLVSKGLGVGTAHRHIYTTIEDLSRADPDRAKAAAQIIADRIAPFEEARSLGDGFWRNVEAMNIKTPHFAPYLRTQVRCFPRNANVEVANAIARNQFVSVVRLYLAGADRSLFVTCKTTSNGIPRFIALTQSNHGRLHISTEIPDLESYLPDPVSKLGVFG